jgi:hypothetical protein
MNTKNASHFLVTNKKQVDILKRLYQYDKNNYYVTELTTNEEKEISGLAKELESAGSGGIIIRPDDKPQPVIIPPVVRVSNDLENYEKGRYEFLQDVKSYIHNLHIYLNSFDGKRSKIYFDSFYQLDSPKYSNAGLSIDYTVLINTLNKLEYSPQKIIISGADIFKYEKLRELTLFLFNHFQQSVIVFVTDIYDYQENENFLTLFFITIIM